MNSLQLTFDDYQAKYETILPVPIRQELTHFSKRFHKFVAEVENARRWPDIAYTITQLTVLILSLIPSINPSLEAPKQFCKDWKNVMNVTKVFKWINCFIHGRYLSPFFVMSCSGLVLVTISALSLAERVGFACVCAIKTALKATPLFGLLPYGGLMTFSITGLTGMAVFIELEARGRMHREEKRIANEKFPFWSKQIDLDSVRQQQLKYHEKLEKVRSEIADYEELIDDGKEVQEELGAFPDQVRRIYACQKALEELGEALGAKQKELSVLEEKESQWLNLEKNWSTIDPEELEAFRRAKYEKWEIKLDKVQQEKRANLLSVISNLVICARQALLIVGVVMGFGLIVLPVMINTVVDATGFSCNVTTFFMKRSIKKIEIVPVSLEIYVRLEE